jgi:hypothetical protein
MRTANPFSQANAPRPPRDGGYTAPVTDHSADNGGFGGDGAGDGGAIDWADDANDAAEPADWEKPSGGAANTSASWDVSTNGNW